MPHFPKLPPFIACGIGEQVCHKSLMLPVGTIHNSEGNLVIMCHVSFETWCRQSSLSLKLKSCFVTRHSITQNLTDGNAQLHEIYMLWDANLHLHFQFTPNQTLFASTSTKQDLVVVKISQSLIMSASSSSWKILLRRDGHIADQVGRVHQGSMESGALASRWPLSGWTMRTSINLLGGETLPQQATLSFRGYRRRDSCKRTTFGSLLLEYIDERFSEKGTRAESLVL